MCSSFGSWKLCHVPGSTSWRVTRVVRRALSCLLPSPTASSAAIRLSAPRHRGRAPGALETSRRSLMTAASQPTAPQPLDEGGRDPSLRAIRTHPSAPPDSACFSGRKPGRALFGAVVRAAVDRDLRGLCSWCAALALLTITYLLVEGARSRRRPGFQPAGGLRERAARDCRSSGTTVLHTLLMRSGIALAIMAVARSGWDGSWRAGCCYP